MVLKLQMAIVTGRGRGAEREIERVLGAREVAKVIGARRAQNGRAARFGCPIS
jgi:hypothetical protein